MHKGRLEAFSDGVIAIIITIMVLELKVPHGDTFADIAPLLPIFGSYVLSFIFVGIYWNNHHHLLQMVKNVNGAVLWANLHLLFWLSLIPVGTAWMGENDFTAAPVFLYGIILMFCGIAYFILVKSFFASDKDNVALKKVIGSDLKGKISVIIYLVGILFAFYNSYVAYAIYSSVALMWLIPDRRIENNISS